MAPLSRTALALSPVGFALLFFTLSCTADGEVGQMQVDVFVGEVVCPLGEPCVDAYGEPAPFDDLRGFAFISTESSAHRPDGLFVYFEIERPGGVLGRGEMDLPSDSDADAEPSVRYQELRDGEVIFESESAVGVVELPEDRFGEQCECLDGRLELVLRSADGDTRRLSSGRFGWGDRPCTERVRFTELGDDVRVIPRSCGVSEIPRTPTPSGSSSSGGGSGSGSGGWSSSTYDTGSCDTSGCSGGGSSGSCESSGGGCDGGGGSGCDGGGGGGGGCEGDTGGGGGCEGDAGGAGCEGDAGGCRVAGRRRQIGPRGPQQTGILVAMALAFILRPRRFR